MLQTLTTFCANDSKGHSLLQTSFTELTRSRFSWGRQVAVWMWCIKEGSKTDQVQVFLWSSGCCVSLEVEESTASHWQQRRGSPVTRFGSSASLPSDSSTTLPSAFRCLATWVDFGFRELGPTSSSSSSSSSKLNVIPWRYNNNKYIIKKQNSLWCNVLYIVFSFVKYMFFILFSVLWNVWHNFWWKMFLVTAPHPTPPHTHWKTSFTWFV